MVMVFAISVDVFVIMVLREMIVLWLILLILWSVGICALLTKEFAFLRKLLGLIDISLAVAILVTLELTVPLPFVMEIAIIMENVQRLIPAPALEERWERSAKLIAAVEDMELASRIKLAYATLDISSTILLRNVSLNVWVNQVLNVMVQISQLAVQAVSRELAIMAPATVGLAGVDRTVQLKFQLHTLTKTWE